MGIADIPKLLSDLVTEHGSATIRGERILQLKEQVEALMEKVKELESQNSDLEKENSKLAAQLKAKTCEEEFVEHRGALFKRKPEGGYHLAVYCPVCRHSVDSIEAIMPYVCERDKWWSSFRGNEIDKVRAELP
jgi:primosomal protein N'